MAIQGFARQIVQRFFTDGALPKKRIGWTGMKGVVKRKLDMVDYAAALEDLKAPPGNRLEPLKGTWPGSTAFGSTISGGWSFAGRMLVRRM